MSTRQQATRKGYGRALDLWDPPEGAGEALVCLATTFTFDAAFFETECVGRFLNLDSHPSESDAVGYLIEREEKLADARICALVDRRHARDKESLRWDILPVLVPRAIQHAKLSLLLWANHLRIIIGSANLTEPGYRSNLEVCGSIDMSRVDGGPRDHVIRCLEFLKHVLDLAVGDDSRQGPIKRARESLTNVRRQIKRWSASTSRTRLGIPVFGGLGPTVLAQLEPLLPSRGAARAAYIVSPFFDQPPSDRMAATHVVGLLAKKKSTSIDFQVRCEDLPDGRLRAHISKGVVDEARLHCDVQMSRVDEIQDGETRPLHAKMLSLENSDWQLLMIGSSNFTTGGLGLQAHRANLEANLVYRCWKSHPNFRQLSHVWPSLTDDAIDPDSADVVWDPQSEAEGEDASGSVLPQGFVEALFRAGASPQLVLVLAKNLPASWTILTVDGEGVVSSDACAPGEHTLDWTGRSVPFVLEVSWLEEETWLTSSWAVNVEDPSNLPPPDILRDLTLEELVTILGSTRPLAQAVVQAIKRRGAPKHTTLKLDPHKRVNTEAFLLRRTRRVARALTRLTERLERPTMSPEGFEWRLNGPVGPRALAKAFAAEAKQPGEAAFFLAELALSLSRVRPDRPAAGGVTRESVRQLLSESIASIQKDAQELDASQAPSGPLRRYVDRAFKAAHQ